MLCQTHIINIRLLWAGIRKPHRIIPETEAIDTAFTLCYCKKGLAVISFYSRHQIVFPIQVNGSGVHHRIHPKTLHEIRVGIRIQIISPVNRRMFPCQNRIDIPVKDSIVKITFLILLFNQLILFCFFSIITGMNHTILHSAALCQRLNLLITSMHILPLWYGHFHGSTIGFSKGFPSSSTAQYHSEPSRLSSRYSLI